MVGFFSMDELKLLSMMKVVAQRAFGFFFPLTFIHRQGIPKVVLYHVSRLSSHSRFNFIHVQNTSAIELQFSCTEYLHTLIFGIHRYVCEHFNYLNSHPRDFEL